MATVAERLITIRSQVLDRLEEVTASPKPNYSVDGESYSWGEYQRMLLSQVADLTAQIQVQEDPFEVRSQAY